MKLYKAVQRDTTECSLDNSIIRENNFLHRVLESQERHRKLELMRTVLDCIEKEGTVSKSIEIMFGESFTDVANAKDELQKACEDFYSVFDYSKYIKNIKLTLNDIQVSSKECRNYFDKNEPHIKFPLNLANYSDNYPIEFAQKLFHNITVKMQDCNIESMTKEERSAKVKEFIELSTNMRREFDKWFYSTSFKKYLVKSKEGLVKILTTDCQTLITAYSSLISTSDKLMNLFDKLCSKTDLDSSERHRRHCEFGDGFVTVMSNATNEMGFALMDLQREMKENTVKR